MFDGNRNKDVFESDAAALIEGVNAVLAFLLRELVLPSRDFVRSDDVAALRVGAGWLGNDADVGDIATLNRVRVKYEEFCI